MTCLFFFRLKNKWNTSSLLQKLADIMNSLETKAKGKETWTHNGAAWAHNGVAYRLKQLRVKNLSPKPRIPQTKTSTDKPITFQCRWPPSQYSNRSDLDKSKLPSANWRFPPLQNPKALTLLNLDLSLPPIACRTIWSH